MKQLTQILKLYMPMLPFIVGFYGVRLGWWHYAYGTDRIRPPWVVVQLIASLIPMGILAMILGVILVIIITTSLKYTASHLPSAFLFAGIFLMMLLPLPEPPPLPETAHFLEYRADYKHVIQLIQSENLRDPRPNYCTNLPSEFQHLSTTECIDVSNNDSGFFVRFNPLDPYDRPIVYIESDEDINFCLRDFYIEAKIEDRWYVCFEDWN
jgi:hypothetical protein